MSSSLAFNIIPTGNIDAISISLTACIDCFSSSFFVNKTIILCYIYDAPSIKLFPCLAMVYLLSKPNKLSSSFLCKSTMLT